MRVIQSVKMDKLIIRNVRPPDIDGENNNSLVLHFLRRKFRENNFDDKFKG